MTGADTRPSHRGKEGAMYLKRRRRWFAGLILGLGPAAPAHSQDLPPGLPPLPEGMISEPRPASESSPILRPNPHVVQVPPGGFQPTWFPGPIDPIALERHQPKHVDFKRRSWCWRRLQGKWFGYPENFEPRPLGASLYDNGLAMVANGAAARMVLYRFDFLPNSAELSPRGLDQLAKIAPQLAASPFPLIVERTPDQPALAEARRMAIVARLAIAPTPISADRIFVGVPLPVGLSGPDSQVIAGNSLGRTQAYGPPIPINSNGVNSPSGVTGISGAAANGGINP
ncbi:hypothetical protein P12x_002430 [Tundrisphaera lichenicola]|uniref:hypothetical protein n=1 Tax=Tundrisphaera lichenicola TaxID=2029860 RepID=UPI003EBE9A1F